MTTTRRETVSVADGSFDAHLAVPSAGHGPGLLVLQEIFGVNEYIRDVCDRLAALGYVAMAPDVFWRLQPGVEFDSSDPAVLEPAMQLVGKWDADAGLADMGAALAHLSSLPEVHGRVGVIGFCFGGTQAFRVAKHLEPACAVSYYGSGVSSMLDGLDALRCPILFHFGDSDPYLPNEMVDAVKAATKDKRNVEIRVHAGGRHAFDNRFAPHFSQPEIAAEAWQQTAAFLFMHLGGPGTGA